MLRRNTVKKVLAICLLFAVTFLAACVPRADIKYDPMNFPGTYWSTRDGKIAFRVEAECIVRFEGRTQISTGEFVGVQPVETCIFGEISTADKKYDFFVVSRPYCYSMEFFSEELPLKTVGDEDYFDVLEKYELLVAGVEYKNESHFVLEIQYSAIDEIPIGTKLDFYRSDAD